MKHLITIVLLMQAFYASYDISAMAPAKKPWTFLAYMAAANSLSDYSLYDIQEMMKVGSNDQVNILVYLTLHQNGQPKSTRKFYIQQGSIMQIGDTVVRDSGDANTLAEAMQWACQDYPSDHLVVDLWNHGSGPLNRDGLLKGICYDDDTGNFLTDRDCLNVFSWAQNTLLNGKKIDIVTCDACLMASLEMAYTFAPCADYFVASQETIPGDGYQYTYILDTLANQSIDPAAFAKVLVAAYSQEYTGTSDYTLSAIDLSAIQPLVDNVNAVANILSAQLKGQYASTVKSVLQKCTASNACLSFYDGIYLDLSQIYANVLQNVSKLKLDKTTAQQLTDLLKSGIVLLQNAVLAKTSSSNYRQAGGLSMYFEKRRVDSSYPNLYWTEHNPQWLQFMKSYIQVSSGLSGLIPLLN